MEKEGQRKPPGLFSLFSPGSAMMKLRARRTELGGLLLWTTMGTELLLLFPEGESATEPESEFDEDDASKEPLFPRGRTLCCCLLLPELLMVIDGS